MLSIDSILNTLTVESEKDASTNNNTSTVIDLAGCNSFTLKTTKPFFTYDYRVPFDITWDNTQFNMASDAIINTDVMIFEPKPAYRIAMVDVFVTCGGVSKTGIFNVSLFINDNSKVSVNVNTSGFLTSGHNRGTISILPNQSASLCIYCHASKSTSSCSLQSLTAHIKFV